jgi:guanine deaminase
MRIHRGYVVHVAGTPTVQESSAALAAFPDGALVVGDDGRIVFTGAFADVPAEYSAAEVDDHRPAFLIPGFVDTHIHFPQTFAGDAYGGGQLLEWLNACIFPSESRYADPEFAADAAAEFVRRRVAAGTTAAMVFGSAFPHAQDSLFSTHRDAGLRVVSGRGVQTTGPDSAKPLMTSEADALRLVDEEIGRWHGADTGDVATALLHVAVVPRFSLSVTRDTLFGLGELYDARRGDGVYFHSHLNENNRPGTGEVDLVKSSYAVDTYLHTYDGHFLPGTQKGGVSFLGRRSIMAHAVHCTDWELARMADTGTSIAHCPVSQQFLGSGTMPWKRTIESGVNVAAGTDFGGGDTWLISEVMSDAFKVHISEPGDAAVSMHPAEMLFTATLAGARALDMEDRFGNFDAGKEADFLVVDPSGWAPLDAAVNHAVRSDDALMARDQTLFALLMTMREPAITQVWVQGKRVIAP